MSRRKVLNMSKVKVHKILKQIEKDNIEVAARGQVIDKSEPKGIVAYQQISRQDFEPLHAVNESMITPENPHSKKGRT